MATNMEQVNLGTPDNMRNDLITNFDQTNLSQETAATLYNMKRLNPFTIIGQYYVRKVGG